MWTVYKHTNLYNNKIYIGITSQPIEDRWKNGNGYKNNQIFYKDIQKYGWKEGFLHEILIIVDSGEEAGEIEQKYIQLYDNQNPNKGYNKAKGGFNSGRLNAPHSQTTKDKIGFKNGKRVLCLETNIIYPSAAEAGRQNNINNSSISACCRNTRKSVGNLHWIYYAYPLSEKERQSLIQQKENNAYKKQSKKIYCVELNKIWASASKAGQDLNINFRNILACCHGQRKTAGSYHWQFYDL